MASGNAYRGLAGDLMREAGWRPLGRPQEYVVGKRWAAAAGLQHRVANWLVFLVLPISNFPGKDRIKKRKKSPNFYVLATNSGLFKALCRPNKTCLPVVSSLCFKSVKDQLKHLSQLLRDFHFPILDVSCFLPLLQDCFYMYFAPHSQAIL